MGTSSLEQRRASPHDIFPQPEPGAIVEVNPPAFNWLPVEGAGLYQVIVQDAAGSPVVDETAAANYLILRRPLQPGQYRWDLRTPWRARGWWPFTIADDAVKQVMPVAEEVLARLPDRHPRHVYYPEDIPKVVAAHTGELEVLRRNIAIAAGEGLPPRPSFHLVKDEELRALQYRQEFERHRRFVDRNLVACAFGHLLLRDGQAAEMARRVMLEICSWDPQGPCAVDGPWGDEIGLSHARCLFAVWDWTFDLYDQAENRAIVAALLAYARQIDRRLRKLDFFSRPGHSHAGRLPAYLGEAALCLKGHAPDHEARGWLQYALDVFGSFFPFYGGRDGGWAEGAFYASSYTKWCLPFMLALERHTGLSLLDRPFYRHVSQFFLHFAPPGWEVHPFGDGYWCRSDSQEWLGFFAQNPFGVYADRFGPELARGFSRRLAPRDRYDLHLLDVFAPPGNGQHGDAAGPAQQSRAFRDAGFVSMHACIEDPDQDTAVLARASKYGTASHQHADQGGLAIISRGKGLMTPSGYFGAAYGTEHHRDWTRQTKAHNCILVDGQGQPAGSHLATGRIEFLRDGGCYAVAGLDLSAAYEGLATWRRMILLVRPELVVVYDDLASDRLRAYSWLAHCLSAPVLAEGRVTVNRPPASMQLQLFTAEGAMPDPAYTDQFDTPVNAGVPERFAVAMPNQHHLRWDAPPAARRRFAAVIAVNGAEASAAWDAGLLDVAYRGHKVTLPLSTGSAVQAAIDGHALAD